MGYYNCGPCGFRAIQKTERGNRLFLERVRRDPEPEEVPKVAPENPANPSDSQKPKQPEPVVKKRPAGLLQNSIFSGVR
ncbi:hypothetical protein [Burkholderia sp. Tr-20390]|uniref:hypothetical protein n=1 Tax=Burkholderia sp. Tr-20390 TaxID=2703904 RepID=UPI001980702B|nr:hypothetical protein [Burkholderia sp. Tr-20390]MBN3734651.1 hypothetical protein [Burkholderia sp. Tr-20390]